MGKLPQVSGRDLVKAFKKEGWVEASQKGSHLKLVKYLRPDAFKNFEDQQSKY